MSLHVSVNMSTPIKKIVKRGLQPSPEKQRKRHILFTDEKENQLRRVLPTPPSTGRKQHIQQGSQDSVNVSMHNAYHPHIIKDWL